MKKTVISAAVLAVLTGLLAQAKTAGAQGNQPKSPPHKVGVIDMAHVFKNYKKFEALREDLKKEIEGSDQRSKQMAAQIQELQKELKAGTFKDGSPEKTAREEKLIELTTRYQTFRKQQQMEFLKKEAQIYKTVYLEVVDAVRLYARHYEYTMVLRYSREGIHEADDPQEILNGMNRLVVFMQDEDDCTLPVLDYLNREYQKQAGRTAAGTPRAKN